MTNLISNDSIGDYFPQLNNDCSLYIISFLSEIDVRRLHQISHSFSTLKIPTNVGYPVDTEILYGSSEKMDNIRDKYNKIVHVKVTQSRYYQTTNEMMLPNITHLNWEIFDAKLLKIPNQVTYLFLKYPEPRFIIPNQVEILKLSRNNIEIFSARIYSESKLVKIIFEENNEEIRPLRIPGSVSETISFEKPLFYPQRIVWVEDNGENIDVQEKKIKSSHPEVIVVFVALAP